jgi:8-oxo-dGTP diphosphatase
MELQVVIGIIINRVNKKVFLSKRKDDVHMGGLWEFPGGKVNIGEGLGHALCRELREESLIIVHKYKLFERIYYSESTKGLSLYFFLIEEYSGIPSSGEGNDIKWVGIDDLTKYCMPPANNQVVCKIQSLIV